MVSEKHVGRPETALLCASSANSGLMVQVCGRPLLAQQITALRDASISRFLIEVDNVPGELLALTDHYRQIGCHVDFVRTAADLHSILGATERLLVQAETLYLAPSLMTDLLDDRDAFVLTVDGRDENIAFERMDINTRWAGLAIVNRQTIVALGSLPEGWSIASSLLRQAMQDETKRKPLPQQEIQHGQALLVVSDTAAETLSNHILADRTRDFHGVIESRIFAPVAIRLAPWIWRSSSGSSIIDGAMIVSAGTSVLLSTAGWTMWASATALATVFLNSVHKTLHDSSGQRGFARFLTPLSWLLLLAAAMIAGYNDPSYSDDGIYSALIMAGLLLLSHHLNLPMWAQRVLKSPASVTLALLLAIPLVGFTQAAQWISTGQLLALIVAKWTIAHPRKPKEP